MKTVASIELKRKLNQTRLEEQEIKEQSPSWNEKSIPVNPQDIEVMFAGHLCEVLLKSKVKLQLIKKGYQRDWGEVPPEVDASIEAQFKSFEEAFNKAKRNAMKIASSHPLWDKFKNVSGLSGYQLALVMAHMRNPERFETPSALCVWAGVASIGNMALAKRNLAKIKELRFKENREFTGFNTKFSGRMFVIADCLIRAKGYFYVTYVGIRKRLEQRCINNDEVFEKDGKLYMKNKNNQSLDIFTHANAKRRIMRTLLHLIWTEWRLLNGLEVREPYPIDYLGHNKLITLKDVVEFDSVN